MSIELVVCNFVDTQVSVMKIDNQFFTTGAVLAQVYGVTPNSIIKAKTRHPEHFVRSLSMNFGHAKEEVLNWLQQHKDVFLIERMRKDLVLYELRDAIKLAFYVNSEKASDFSDEVIEYYMQNMQMSSVPMEAHQAVLDRLLAVENELSEIRPFLKTTATSLGKGLAAQRGTKKTRDDVN